jgi:galactose mutarotase-like enzyme
VGAGGELEIDLQLEQRWQRDDDVIPTGVLEPIGAPPPEGWDDCFTVAPGGVVGCLRWPGAVELCIDSSCPNAVVYSQPAHAVCVEPQTGAPDAFNRVPNVVRQGEPLVATMRWSWVLG